MSKPYDCGPCAGTGWISDNVAPPSPPRKKECPDCEGTGKAKKK